MLTKCFSNGLKWHFPRFRCLFWFWHGPAPLCDSGTVAGMSGRRWGRELDSADRPNVAPEEFKRQENKQAFWSQRAHSLSLTLFLSFSPSLPLPLPLSMVVSPQLSSPDLYFLSIFLLLKPLHVSLVPPLSTFFSILSTHLSSCFDWKTRAAERQTSEERQTDIIWPARGQTDRQTETQTRASLFHKHTVMLQSRGTRHGKCLHHSIFSTKHEQGLRRKLSPPATQTFSAVTDTLAASFRLYDCVCESVFSYAYRWGWCEKASPITVLLSRVSAAHSGCGSVTICPLRPVFHFKNTPDFLR